uniref:Proteasome activator Blm10 mid region domain-containing protein n=1 Tax=Romanomermis culicivorax TaxID=13658 RepID=A0A915JHA3_ROMCU
MEEESKKYQKLNSYVKFLPYYDDIEKEADWQLRDIKSGLAYSILWREQRPALIHWACELDRYVHLYGFRFSKEDHVLFVKTMYELIVMPGMELRLVKTFSLILNNLLKKISLLSRDDLVVPWRPLYDLYYFVAYKSLEEEGLFMLPSDLCKSIENLIARARNYFPKESTREILTEFRPLMCIWDASYLRAWNCLNLFLPTRLSSLQEHESHGFKLWIDELSSAIFGSKNEPPWAPSVYDLLARLVFENVGYVDLEPYMDEIFTKILRPLEK